MKREDAKRDVVLRIAYFVHPVTLSPCHPVTCHPLTQRENRNDFVR